MKRLLSLFFLHAGWSSSSLSLCVWLIKTSWVQTLICIWWNVKLIWKDEWNLSVGRNHAVLKQCWYLWEPTVIQIKPTTNQQTAGHWTHQRRSQDKKSSGWKHQREESGFKSFRSKKQWKRDEATGREAGVSRSRRQLISFSASRSILDPSDLTNRVEPDKGSRWSWNDV